jgi:membrane protease YdiL (CAAX protease family)
MDIIRVLLLFLALTFILWLANVADRQRARGQAESGQVTAIIAYVLLGLLYAALILVGLVFQLLGLFEGSPFVTNLDRTYRQMGIQIASYSLLGLGFWLPSLVGLVLLLRPVRRVAGRLLPQFDPLSTVHAVALSYSTLIGVNLLATIGFGIGNLGTSVAGSAYNLLPLLWAQDLASAALALVGVGWLSRRSLRGALGRLGIVPPTPLQTVLGLGLGIVLAIVVLVVEYLASTIGITPGADVERLTEQLLGPLTRSAAGILTMGVAAALGEESLFRGALQPRFGLLFTALLFALLHGTYGLSFATLLVFLVGLILGLARQRANTSTTMILHAVYNMTLGVIAYVGLMQKV